MIKPKTHADKTASEKKSIGFDYQYYFFLWKVISLQPNESVGLEVRDDVHCELNNNHQLLYQIKHSLKKQADGITPKNLTTSDLDMWKTFSNWSKVISDSNDARNTKKAQQEFIKKTNFVLASNKSSNESNTVIQKINDLRESVIDETAMIIFLENLKNDSKDGTLQGYIDDVLKLDNDVLKEFFLKTFFELDNDDIISKCKEAIKSKMIPIEKIDQAFKNLDSSIRESNYLTIKEGEKVEIKFDDFYIKYRRYFDIYRNGNLTVQEYKGVLPDNLLEQIFVKQLQEIGFIGNDLERIAELTRFKLKLINNLEAWKNDGNISETELFQLKNNAINGWKLEHDFKYIGQISVDDYNQKGLEILQAVLKTKLKLDSQDLDVDLCYGKFYSLSDEPIIGWRKDWEKYKI